jgi:hypothetical protein
VAKRKDSSTAGLYSVHPSVAYVQAIFDNLQKRTGKTLDQWLGLIGGKGPAGDKERVAWLKKEYQLGGTTAWMLVERAAGRGAEDTDPDAYLAAAPKYVDAMYSGPKAALRPIHERLIELGRSMGPDVKICPCQTIVPFYRNHVFAEIKPATRTRIDFGLALKGVKEPIPKRAIDTGGLKKGDRITHRFPIAAVQEIDQEVARWLRIAYDLDA